MFSDGKNLTEAEQKTFDRKYGDGGFLPFGWEGVMRGAGNYVTNSDKDIIFLIFAQEAYT